MYEITMQLPFNGYHVEGRLSLPVKAQSLIIFSHGHGRSTLTPHEHRLALRFQEEGFATLTFDTFDLNNKIPTDSKALHILSNGLIATTNWIHSHSEYKSLGLAYFGSGTGAAAAIKAAGEVGAVIRSIVSLSGRMDLVKPELKNVTSPTLLIVGELDFQLVNVNKHALDKLNIAKQLAVVPGASHLFEEADKLNEAAKIAVSWFKKYIPRNKEVAPKIS